MTMSRKFSETNPNFELRDWHVEGDVVVGAVYNDISETYLDGFYVTITNIKSITNYKDHNIIVFGKEKDYYVLAKAEHKHFNGE